MQRFCTLIPVRPFGVGANQKRVAITEGVNPANFIVRDVYENVGAENQNCIQKLSEGDLIFVGRNGVQTMSRVVQEKSARVHTLSRFVHSQLIQDFRAITDFNEISTVVDPTRGLFLVTFQDQGRTWAFHYTRPFRSNDTGDMYYPVTTWDLATYSWFWDSGNNRLLLGYAGGVGLYGGGDTDNGTAFRLEYESPWLTISEDLANYLKIVKRLGTIMFVQSQTDVTLKWAFDFSTTFKTKSLTFVADSASEWGVAEWGLGEWSGIGTLRIKKIPAYGTGQYIKLAVSVEIASEVSIQQLEVFAKIGRFA